MKENRKINSGEWQKIDNFFDETYNAFQDGKMSYTHLTQLTGNFDQ